MDAIITSSREVVGDTEFLVGDKDSQSAWVTSRINFWMLHPLIGIEHLKECHYQKSRNMTFGEKVGLTFSISHHCIGRQLVKKCQMVGGWSQAEKQVEHFFGDNSTALCLNHVLSLVDICKLIPPHPQYIY